MLAWACHRKCRHYHEDRFRPYGRGDLTAVVAEAEANVPRVVTNLPERMTYRDGGQERVERIILSGGQRVRVAPMRVLPSRRRALLLDEPFGRLVAPLRGRMRRLVFDAARARGLPMLLVTHNAEDLAASGGRVVELSRENCPIDRQSGFIRS